MRLIAYLVLLMSFTNSVFGQENQPEIQLFSVEIKHISLDHALTEFSSITGSGVTYDPRITEGRAVYCVLQDAEIEELLLCILESTNLTFARLASGTFVVTPKGQVEAQQGYLTGLVTDNATGTPLIDAHILLASNVVDIGVITNNRGQFTLPALLPGKYLLQTSYLGYTSTLDTLHIQPGVSTFHKVALKANPVRVSPIVIDGLQAQHLSEKLDRTSLLRSSTAASNDYTTYPAQFKSVSGIRINDLTADAHLQGSNAGEHQFRIDGVPIFLPQQAVGIIGPFSPFAIQSLTIHKSGFGVEEGSHLAGVIEARQFIESESIIDAQIDFNAINNRISWNRSWDNQKSFSIMAASRFSLWSLFSQPQLENMLNQWVRPDPFLIFTPSQQFSSIDLSILQDALDISAIPTTSLSFTDVHIATQYKTNAFSGFNASFYLGDNQFGGSLIPPAIFSPTGLNTEVPPISPGGEAMEENNLEPIISVIDEYDWYNIAGQLQYHTLLGKNTLLNVQARGSTYKLDQTYFQVDSLQQILRGIPETDFSTVSLENLAFPTKEINDQNSTTEYAIEGQLDIAWNNHSLLLGIASAFTESTLDALLTSLPSLEANEDGLASPPVDPAILEDDRVGFNSGIFRQSLFLQDRYTFSNATSIEAGTRLTYIPNRKTVYAEPRLAIRFDLPVSTGKTLALQSAVGLYRQYLLQLDVSTLNAGALFASKRIWIPVNRDIRPPLAYHISQSVLYTQSNKLTIKLEGYLKYQQRLWFLSALSSDTLDRQSNTTSFSTISNLNDILSPGKGVTRGVSFSTIWSPSPFTLSLVYDFTSVERKSPDLFFGDWFSAPWEEPHRVTGNIEYNYEDKLWLSAQFNGIWNRSWGYRQAYYDFFGHNNLTTPNTDIDFSNPDEHILPAYYQVDLSAVYNLNVSTANIQIRLDLLNAFDIANVADWRLVWKDGSLEKENRYYYPRIPSLALRFSW